MVIPIKPLFILLTLMLHFYINLCIYVYKLINKRERNSVSCFVTVPDEYYGDSVPGEYYGDNNMYYIIL